MATAIRAEELPPDALLTKQALAHLDQRLNAKFDIPFPKDWDIDAHSKQPIALIAVDGGKVTATRPLVNPYDGRGTIEWMIGPEKVERLPQEDVMCILYLDQHGDFLQMGLLSTPDAWPSEPPKGHQLKRRDDETGPAFFQRAMLTYRLRTKNAKEPVQALNVLAAFEKMAKTIQELRKEEGLKKK
ncbi:hypothetical protein [Luteolibacter sp. Populi]|uniref:hypothetical protein n=1 Tax=Luteolibacter sp. Populi TaxID=3230487 RepID=UPI0034670A72